MDTIEISTSTPTKFLRALLDFREHVEREMGPDMKVAWFELDIPTNNPIFLRYRFEVIVSEELSKDEPRFSKCRYTVIVDGSLALGEDLPSFDKIPTISKLW